MSAETLAPTVGRSLVGLREGIAAVARRLEGVERPPVQLWVRSEKRRTLALAVVLAAVAVVAMTTDRLLAGTLPLIPKTHFPLLLGGLFAVGVLLRRAPGALRRTILLVASASAATYFSPSFAAISFGYATALYGVLVAPVHRALKLGFVALTFAFVTAAYARLLPTIPVERGTVTFLLYAFALNYGFRICYLLHELDAAGYKRRPRYVDVLLYLLFPPFFVIVPSMACIPRFGRFVASLDRPMPDGDISAIRHATRGVLAVAFVIAGERLIHPYDAYLAATHEHRWGAALVLGLLSDPVWRVLSFLGTAHVLTAMMHLLGIDVSPPVDRALRSENVLEWWRRWNVHFRGFLVDIFFYPVLMRCSRRPTMAIVLGCAGVFLVGSTAAHCLLAVFRRGTCKGAAGPIFAESLATCAVVVACLVAERRRLGKRARVAPPPRLSDPRASLSACAAAAALRAARILLTMITVFATTTGAQDVAHHVQHVIVHNTTGGAP